MIRVVRANLGMGLLASSLLACSGAEAPDSVVDTAVEEPTGSSTATEPMIGTFTLDVNERGEAKVTMVDSRLATTLPVGATAGKVNLVTLSKDLSTPGLFCVNMRLQSLYTGQKLAGATVTLTKLANVNGATAANSDGRLPSHLVGTTASDALGVWLFGHLDPSDSLDRQWCFHWTGGSISVAGKVFADVRALAAEVETSCSDGFDDDGDAVADCLDGDCALDGACPAETCDIKGRDEDSNGATDCEDSACDGHPLCTESVCDDGADNDDDGAYDCEDSDCEGHPGCGGGGVPEGVFFADYSVGMIGSFLGSTELLMPDDNMWGLSWHHGLGDFVYTDHVDGVIRRTRGPFSSEDILTGLTAPTYLSVNQGTGELYFIANGNLNRSEADGSAMVVLATGVNNNTLEVAFEIGKVYYARDNDLLRANLDGSDEETVVADLNGEPGDVVVVPGGMLVSDRGGSSIIQYSLDGSTSGGSIPGVTVEGMGYFGGTDLFMGVAGGLLMFNEGSEFPEPIWASGPVYGISQLGIGPPIE